MLNKTLLSSAAALAMLLTAVPAKAEVSLMYAEWLSSLVEPGIAAFEKETGEKVNAIKLPGAGYDQRTALDLSAGTAADVIQMDSFMVSEFASSGYLEPLNEQAKGWDQFQYYMPGLLEVASYDGKVYALPTDTDVRMLWYDKANFAKAGIPVPWEPKNWTTCSMRPRSSRKRASSTSSSCPRASSRAKAPPCRASTWRCSAPTSPAKRTATACSTARPASGSATAPASAIR